MQKIFQHHPLSAVEREGLATPDMVSTVGPPVQRERDREKHDKT
jgi:hypothetical protein